MQTHPVKLIQYVILLTLLTSWVVYAIVEHNPRNYVVLMWVSIGIGVMYGLTEVYHIKRVK